MRLLNKLTKSLFKVRYDYLVIYTYQNSEGEMGSGRGFYNLAKPLDRQGNIEYLEDYIKNHQGFDKLFISNFKLLGRTYEGV